jgi:hypothetical protein
MTTFILINAALDLTAVAALSFVMTRAAKLRRASRRVAVVRVEHVAPRRGAPARRGVGRQAPQAS